MPLVSNVQRSEPSQVIRITNYGEANPEALQMAVNVAIAAGGVVIVDSMGMQLSVYPDSSARDLMTLIGAIKEINRLNQDAGRSCNAIDQLNGQVSNLKKKYDTVTADLQNIIKDQEAGIEEKIAGAVLATRAEYEEKIRVVEDKRWTECMSVGVKCEKYSRENTDLKKTVEEQKNSIIALSDQNKILEKGIKTEQRRYDVLVKSFNKNEEHMKGDANTIALLNARIEDLETANGVLADANTQLIKSNKDMDSILKSGKLVELEPEEKELVGDLLIKCAAGLSSNKSGERLIHTYISPEFAEQLQALKEKEMF